MTILDDVVGIAVFFTVNSLIARMASSGTIPLYMIPVMIFLPIITGVIVGFPTGLQLKKCHKKSTNLMVLLCGITFTMLIGWIINTYLLFGITLNYMLMGVALLAAIVDLGSPLDYHLILGAGLYTFIYIAARAFGKYFGARIGAKCTHMPDTVKKYLGLTLLPHSSVSLVFTGIICSTLASAPELFKLYRVRLQRQLSSTNLLLSLPQKKALNWPKK